MIKHTDYTVTHLSPLSDQWRPIIWPDVKLGVKGCVVGFHNKKDPGSWLGLIILVDLDIKNTPISFLISPEKNKNI